MVLLACRLCGVVPRVGFAFIHRFKHFCPATKMNPATTGAAAAGSTQASLSPFLAAPCVYIGVGLTTLMLYPNLFLLQRKPPAWEFLLFINEPHHSCKLYLLVQVSLKDAIRAAVAALTRPDAMSAEDKALLKLKWENNSQKRPNAPQEVSSCACARRFACSKILLLPLST